MGLSIGELFATVGADVGPLRAGRNQSRKIFRDIERDGTQRLNILQNNFARTAASVVGIGSAIFALQGSVGVIRDFGQAMSTVSAVSGGTAEEIQAIRNETKRLGSTTRFTATQAAEGVTFLARAGFSAAQSLEAVEGTLLLAQAGALDLGRAADIASNILTGFGLDAAKTNRVVDVLAFTANNANTNVEQLGEAMKFAAPIAAGLNLSVSDTSAAIGALSDAGIQATLAGTGLRSILVKLAAPSEELQRTLGGVSIETDGLIPVLEKLKAANVGVAESVELFDKRTAAAVNVLVNSIPKLKEMGQEMQELDDFAKNVAATMDNNLNGAIFAVQSAIQGLILEIGDLGAESTLTSAVRSTATAIRALSSNVEAFVPVVKTMAIVLGTVLASGAVKLAARALGGLATLIADGIGRKSVGAIGSLRSNIALLFTAIRLHPIGAFAAAIGSTLVGVVLFRKEIMKWADAIVFMREETSSMSSVTVSLGDIFRGTAVVMSDGLSGIRQGFADAASAARDFNDFVAGELRSRVIGSLSAIGIEVKSLADVLRFLFLPINFDSSAIVDEAAMVAAMRLTENALREQREIETQFQKTGRAIKQIQAAVAGAKTEEDIAKVGASIVGVQSEIMEYRDQFNFVTSDVKDNVADQIAAVDSLQASLDAVKGALASVTLDGKEAPEKLLEFPQDISGIQDAVNGLENLEGALAHVHDRAEELPNLFDETREAMDRAFSDTARGKIRDSALRIQNLYGDAARQLERTFTNSVRGLENLFVQFATNQKVTFKDLVNSIQADLARLAFRKFIVGTLTSALSGAFSGGNSGSGEIIGAPIGTANPGGEFVTKLGTTPDDFAAKQGGVTVVQQIKTDNPDMFRRSAPQLARSARRAAEREWRRS